MNTYSLDSNLCQQGMYEYINTVRSITSRPHKLGQMSGYESRQQKSETITIEKNFTPQNKLKRGGNHG